MDNRLQDLTAWLSEQLPNNTLKISNLAGDASFRRYFRATDSNDQSLQWVVMDAPPAHEDCVPFIAVANSWGRENINVPEIIASDLEKGFILLSDFGDELYLNSLTETTADQLYGKAIESLLDIQQSKPIQEYPLPPYDEALLNREMALFTDWLIAKQLQYSLSDNEKALIDKVFAALRQNALEQPQVPVHRDYHSRNLMVCQNTPGILDFQDAVMGPITYDLVSLLKDCYIVWPAEKVNQWLESYAEKARSKGLTDATNEQLSTWFNRMGMQRHIKASGIFARLSIRDGKHSYLNDIPRTVNYIVEATKHDPVFGDFADWLEDKIVPLLADLREPAEACS